MRQATLFDEPVVSKKLAEFPDVPGLVYRPAFLSPDEQAVLLAEIDSRPWLEDLKRRVQHYGYKYDYKSRAINPSLFVGPLPPFTVDVATRLVDEGLFAELPDQLIVNEYQPGQGISAHVDCEPCFKDVIATISLGWPYEMEFISLAEGERKTMLLDVGSVLVMSGPARYEWTHGIRARQRPRCPSTAAGVADVSQCHTPEWRPRRVNMSDPIGPIPYAAHPERDLSVPVDLAALRDMVRQHERRLDRQAVVIGTLAEMLRNLIGAEADQLLACVQAAVADRQTAPPRQCSGCSRPLGAKQAKCIYCGTAAASKTVADYCLENIVGSRPGV